MIGAYTVFIVKIFIAAMFVLAWPISWLLDKLLGQELGNILSKNQMKKLFEMYEKDHLLNPEERKILSAALELRDKSAGEVMTPLDETFMLDINAKLSEELLHEIYLQGFSRIPVFEGRRENIVGIVLAKDLSVINPAHKKVRIR